MYTWKSEIIREFPRNNSSILPRIVDLCLKMSASNFKLYFGFVTEDIFELVHTIKTGHPAVENLIQFLQ